MSLTAQVTNLLLLEIPKRYPTAVCWRNNTGGAVPLSAIKAAKGFMRARRYKEAEDALSRVIKFGIRGQADISGWIPIGAKPIAVRLEIEIKVGDDEQSHEQKVFQRELTAAGGIYLIAQDVNQALKDLGEAIRQCQTV